jgi:hypothetical protein
VYYRPAHWVGPQSVLRLMVNDVDMSGIVSKIVVESNGSHSTVTLTLPACDVQVDSIGTESW